MRSVPEGGTGLELESFPALTPARLFGQDCGNRKPSGFVGLPGEGGAGLGVTQHAAQNPTLSRECVCGLGLGLRRGMVLMEVQPVSGKLE